MAITKTEFVAKVVGEPSLMFGAEFEATDPDNDDYWRIAGVEYSMWQELGEPDVVTVAIRPGDHLNVE